METSNTTLNIMYVRLPNLLTDLNLTRVQETYRKRLNKYIKYNLLIAEEWALIMTNNVE